MPRTTTSLVNIMKKSYLLGTVCAFTIILLTSTAHANLLTNASVEAPHASAGDVGSSSDGTFGAWNYINSNYVSNNLFMPGRTFMNPTAHSGTQVLKQFGFDRVPSSSPRRVQAILLMHQYMHYAGTVIHSVTSSCARYLSLIQAATT